MGEGNFKDVTENKAFDLKNIGMITDAKWADINGDKKSDLVIVGDWMAPTIFLNNGRRLNLQQTTLDNLTGWWNTILIEDIDKDGDMDLILGNQGENTPYKTSKENPINLYVNDFDNNGTIEQIITKDIAGNAKPIILKKELTSQISSLKKQSLRNADYAKKSINDLFSSDVIDNSIFKTSVESKSIIALNDGKNSFRVIPLPKEVQLSCVCGISCFDVNNDGNLDLLLGGNNFDFKPQYSRLDANYGSLLLGDGKGNFEWVPYSKSGFFITGEVKHLQKLQNKTNTGFFIAIRNNEEPKTFIINE